MYRSGMLIYDPSLEWLDISFDDGSAYGGLHCGTTLEALVNGEYRPTRFEFSDDWYLVGLYPAGQIPVGLKVRI